MSAAAATGPRRRALAALARVELRALRRNPARAWLVVLLVALPVAAMSGGSAWLNTTRRSPEDLATRQLGAARLRVEQPLAAGAAQALAPLLAQAPATPALVALAEVQAPGRRLTARLLALPAGALADDGRARGMAVLERGRWPGHDDECALSPPLAEALGLAPGDTVDVAGVPRRITGLAVDPEELAAPLAVLATAAPHDPALWARLRHVDPFHLLGDADRPLADPALEQRLLQAGATLARRHEVDGEDALETLVLFVVGGFGLLEAALVVAAAFAVGLRRRQRELGLLAAGGADARDLTAGVLVSVALLAGLGCLLGTALGLGLALALQPWLDGWTGRLNGPLVIDPPQVLAACLLGLVAALLAAWLPARSAARRPVREALAGRRPTAGSGGRWLVAGLALAGLGLALVTWGATLDGPGLGVALLAGSVLGLVGLGTASPGLLGLAARRAGALPLAWRLAVRDAGRWRSRNGPVVTAVLAGMALSVTVASLLESVEALAAARRPPLRDDVLLFEGPGALAAARELGSDLPLRSAGELAAAWDERGPVLARLGPEATPTWIAWGAPELLPALGLDGAAVPDGAGLLLVDQADPPPAVDLDGVEAAPRLVTAATDQPLSGPPLVITPAAARALGWRPGPPPGRELVPALVRLDRPVSAEDLDRAAARAAEHPSTRVEALRLHRRAGGGFYRLILLVCSLTGLVVIAIATALAAVESAADVHLLHCVGAGPGLLRRLLAARAAWLALLGCLLAIPAGLLPAYGLMSLAREGLVLRFAVPWPAVLTAVTGLPLLAWLGTWLVARRGSRPPERPAALSA